MKTIKFQEKNLFLNFRYSATFCSLPGRTTTTTEKRRKMFRVFSLYIPLFISIYIFSQTQREREKKRQTREREITRPFEWIDSAQWWRTGIFVFLFFQKFSSVGKKELAKVESNWKHVRYTSICKHAFYIYSSTVYLYRQKRGALTVV